MNNPIFSWAQWALLSVYLVILAGAIVRMTGSGMGCPDGQNALGISSLPLGVVNWTGNLKIPMRKEM